MSTFNRQSFSPHFMRFVWDFCFDNNGLFDSTSFSYLSVYEHHFSKSTIERLIQATRAHPYFTPTIITDLLEFSTRKLHTILKNKRNLIESQVDRNIVGLSAVIFELEVIFEKNLNIWKDLQDVAAKLPQLYETVEETCAYLKKFEEGIECLIVRKKLRTYGAKKNPEEIIMENWSIFYNNVKGKSFAFKHIDDCMATLKHIDPDFHFPFKTFQEAVECIHEAITTIDIRVARNFLPLFYEIFMRTEDFQRAMDCMYNYFRQKDGNVPQFKRFCSRFEDDLKRVLANPPPRITSTRLDFQKYCRGIAFFLTIAPKPTIHTILSLFIELKNNVDLQRRIIEAMRQMTPFFRYKVHIFNAENEEELLVITLFRRTLSIDWERFQLDSYANSKEFLNFFTRLTSTKVFTERPSTIVKKSVPPPPVFDATELVWTIIFLMREKHSLSIPKKFELPLRLLKKLLSMTEATGRYWVIKWKKLPGSPTVDHIHAVNPVDLTNELFDFVKSRSGNEDEGLLRLAAEVFESLVKKFEVDDVGHPFDRMALSFLAEQLKLQK